MRIAILGSGGVGGYFGAPISTTRAHSSRCHQTTTDACAMIPRRVFLGAAALLPLATHNAFAQAPTLTSVHVQDLPDARLDGWTATLVEVRYLPASASQAYRHPGCVLGDVLEGEVRFGVDGGEQTSIAPTRCSTSRRACSTLCRPTPVP